MKLYAYQDGGNLVKLVVDRLDKSYDSIFLGPIEVQELGKECQHEMVTIEAEIFPERMIDDRQRMHRFYAPIDAKNIKCTYEMEE